MKMILKLQDLDCAHCAEKIEKAVKKVEGVNNAKVNFLNQKMDIDVADDLYEDVHTKVKKLVKKIEPDITIVG